MDSNGKLRNLESLRGTLEDDAATSTATIQALNRDDRVFLEQRLVVAGP